MLCTCLCTCPRLPRWYAQCWLCGGWEIRNKVNSAQINYYGFNWAWQFTIHDVMANKKLIYIQTAFVDTFSALHTKGFLIRQPTTPGGSFKTCWVLSAECWVLSLPFYHFQYQAQCKAQLKIKCLLLILLSSNQFLNKIQNKTKKYKSYKIQMQQNCNIILVILM